MVAKMKEHMPSPIIFSLETGYLKLLAKIIYIIKYFRDNNLHG